MEVRKGIPGADMFFSHKLLIPFWAAGALALLAQSAPPKSKLSPRELFYSAGPEHDPHPKAGNSQGKGGKRSSTGSDPKGGSKSGSGGTGSGNPDIIRVAATPAGVTYTLKKLSGKDMVTVSPDAVFQSGDRIQFDVQTNSDGYLYIGNKGPTGNWTPLFPTKAIDNGNNRVEAFKKYTLPSGYRIKFDDPSGTEEVFILFSRQQVADFEQLLYTEKPSAGGTERSKPLNVAKADIPESTVDRLRTAFSRDLILEKIDDSGDTKEKAVYIVNPTGTSDSHVWADIRLVHK